MDLPSLPTDNLYKFMALGGLAGVLLIPPYYLSQWTEAERQGIETYTTMRSLKAETEFVTEDMNNLERDVAREGKTTRKIAVDVKVLEREVAEAGRRLAL